MTPAGFNIAMPEPATGKPTVLYAGWVEYHRKLSDAEVNSMLADLYHSNPPLALALADDWNNRTRSNRK